MLSSPARRSCRRRGTRCFAGADVAEGLEHGDYTDGGGRPVEVLSLHAHREPDQFAELICKVARLYPGLYGIERNNHGLATLLACRRLGMRGIYSERPVLSRTGEVVEPGRPGWLTTSVTKPLVIDDLEQACGPSECGSPMRRRSPSWCTTRPGRMVGTGAPSGGFDDRVMSRAIAVQMRKFLPAKVEPEEDFVRWGTLAPLRW